MKLVYAFLTAFFFISMGCATRTQTFQDNFNESEPIKLSSTGQESPEKQIEGGQLPILDENSTLDDYLKYAYLNNAGLKAAFYEWKSKMQRIPQVTSLPDPKLTYRYFIEQVETRVGAQKQAVGIVQSFPWFDVLELRGTSAEKLAESFRQKFHSEKLKVDYKVKDIYYEYYYIAKTIEIVKETMELVQNFEQVARTRYKTAQAAHPDVVKAQVELGKLEDRLRSVRDLKEPIIAKLNAALNRPVSLKLPTPEKIELPPVTINAEQLNNEIAGSNPEIKALGHQVSKAKADIELAKKKYYPNVSIGLNYIQTNDRIGPNPPSDDGQDPVIAMVSLNLPIWRDNYNAAVKQAQNDYLNALKNRTQKKNDLSSSLKMALYEFRDAERKINLYNNTLIPKATESLKSIQRGYQNGKNSFLELIDAERVLLEFELSYQRALANKAQKLAEIEKITGKKL